MSQITPGLNTNSSSYDSEFPEENTWSPGKTLLISFFIILLGSFFLQILVGALHIGLKMIELKIYSPFDVHIQHHLQDLYLSSKIISQSILFSDIVSILLLVWFVKRKAPGMIFRYFAFNRPALLSFVSWQLVMIAVYFLTNYISGLANIEEPDFMRHMKDILASQSFFTHTMMFLALVIAAPFFEEMLFRGFMYRGLKISRIGTAGSVLLPALIWSVIHIQYELLWISLIFIMGIIFGIARYHTGSIITVISMHAINNLLSYLDVSGI